MESFGEYLRKIRQERGLSIEQVAVKTRISPNYIQALEEDRLEVFPGEVFARGFVRVYGRCLGLDDQDTMARFSQTAQSFFRQQTETQQSRKQLAEQEKVHQERRSHLLQTIIMVALGLTILTVYGINSKRLSDSDKNIGAGTAAPSPQSPAPAESYPDLMMPAVNRPAVQESETKPKPAEAAPPSVSREAAAPVTAKPDKKQPFVVNPPGQSPAPVEGLVLFIEAVEPSWISAKIDGRETKEVFLAAGQKITWKASEQFLVSFGNAGGIKAQLNGKPLPSFGERGAVVKNILLKRE